MGKLTDLEFRRAFYQGFADDVAEFTGVKISARQARHLLVAVFGRIFKRVLTAGGFRLPDGMGAFVLKALPEAEFVRLPSGQMVRPKPFRARVRYNEGVNIQRALGTLPPNWPRRATPHVFDLAKEVDRAAADA